MHITVKSKDAGQVIKALHTYEADTKNRLNAAINRSLNAIRRGAKRRIHKVTGNLSKHIRKTFDPRVSSGTVRSRAFHAHLIEFGTKGIGGQGSKAKPGSKNPVRAKKKGLIGSKPKAMVIPGIGFRFSYRHRGMKARPYLRPAFEEERPRYVKNIIRAVQPKEK